MTRPSLLLCLLLAACGRDIEVRVRIPGADGVPAPAAHLPLVVLPYDRDSVLAALEARLGHSRPQAAALDSLFAAFREPFVAFAARADRIRAIEDTLARLSRGLDSLARNSSAYRAGYARFGDWRDSLDRARRQLSRDSVALDRVRRRVMPLIDTLRTASHRWEDSAYQGYDSIVVRLVRAARRTPLADSTGPDGTARLHLRSGRWWVYARAWDAQDPNAEWYWNHPVDSAIVVLDPSTGRRRPRY